MSKLPNHVAIVMDGNGRWAKRQCLPRIAGHEAGAKVVKEIVKICSEKGIPHLSLFAFSCENWQRPPEEVTHLMSLFLHTLEQETNNLHGNNIRLKVIGDCSNFASDLQKQIAISQERTATNTGLTLTIAANYSGHWDILNATREIANLVKQQIVAVEDINEVLFSAHLSLADLPWPDLFIRTSGEQRISNFMLWQMAYTELYFTDILWPDFTGQTFETALAFYASRERRFGLTSDQIEEDKLNA